MKLIDQMGDEWYKLLSPIIHTNYFLSLGKAISQKGFTSKTIYPEADNIFRAFRECPLGMLKVVVLGQDPFHNGKATGLAFSNKDLFYISPSLSNIFKEVEEDCYNGIQLDQDPDLTRWARQGVLLLNTALTVEKGKPGSHLEMWKPFTKFVLEAISKEVPAVVYLLWGNNAKDYMKYINRECNFVLISAHPSPFSYNKGFKGNKHFSKTNEILKEVGLSLGVDKYEIEW